jgi:hypothetical protein
MSVGYDEVRDMLAWEEGEGGKRGLWAGASI